MDSNTLLLIDTILDVVILLLLLAPLARR